MTKRLRILAIICIVALLFTVVISVELNIDYGDGAYYSGSKYIIDGSEPYYNLTLYFELLNLLVFISAGLIAIRAFQNEKLNWAFIMAVVALLFNPVFLVSLQKKHTWVLLDIASAGIFLGSIFALKKPKMGQG